METYVTNGQDVFKQVRGIPMGGACSSVLADIYLYQYEKQIVIPNDMLFMRYVDDILLCFMGVCKEFAFNFYPDDLRLVENLHNQDGTMNFLDLNIGIINGVAVYKIFNKKDNFNFDINYITSWNSALHRNVFRNTLINHISRCKRLHSSKKQLNTNLRAYVKKAIEGSFPRRFVIKVVSGAMGEDERESRSLYFED